jgi:serine protease AprX
LKNKATAKVRLSLAFILLLAGCLVSVAADPYSAQPLDRAGSWFAREYSTFFKSAEGDQTAPSINGVIVTPSVLKIGDPRSEIDAFVIDPAGIEMVYAEVGNRMNLMLDLNRDDRFTGYCGSNLPPGAYPVTIVAIDKAGNAARDESRSIQILDPKDLNSNRIEDSLEEQKGKDLRVIVLHDSNLNLTSNEFKILPASSMTLSRERLVEISQLKGVKGIYEDKKLKVLDSNEVGQRAIGDPRKCQQLSTLGLSGEGVTVALVDTGADPNHESLSGRILAFKDFVNNQTLPYDDNGHGTHCASLIAGTGGVGVAPRAMLAVIKVMDREGGCYLSDAIKALDWCLENKNRYGIKVVSFSVGGAGPSDGSSILDEACNKMVDQGLVICVAAGNSGPAPGSIVVPGDAEKVITVGAIDKDGNIFEKSSRGPVANGEIKPDIVALGVDVVSALAGSVDSYSSISGTSMAVPQVSGAAALLLQGKAELPPPDVKRMLLKTADDLGKTGPDNIYGYGALNITHALTAGGTSSAGLSSPFLEEVSLNKRQAQVGEPVMIEASARGEVKALSSYVRGPDRNMQIPMDDFDSNGIYSARWETSFWSPGDYEIEVELQGKFGEVRSDTVPFRLDPKG